MNELILTNLVTDLEVLKEKFEDLKTSHGYFADDYFSKRNLETKEELIIHGVAYCEQRIATDQMNELMRLYVEEFEKLNQQLAEVLKKALTDEPASEQ